MIDDETRKDVLRFLRAFKTYQARSLAMKKYIETMCPPKDQASFKALYSVVARPEKADKFEQQIAELEKALGDDGPFLSALKREESFGKLDEFVDIWMDAVLARLRE